MDWLNSTLTCQKNPKQILPSKKLFYFIDTEENVLKKVKDHILFKDQHYAKSWRKTIGQLQKWLEDCKFEIVWHVSMGTCRTSVGFGFWGILFLTHKSEWFRWRITFLKIFVFLGISMYKMWVKIHILESQSKLISFKNLNLDPHYCI